MRRVVRGRSYGALSCIVDEKPRGQRTIADAPSAELPASYLGTCWQKNIPKKKSIAAVSHDLRGKSLGGNGMVPEQSIAQTCIIKIEQAGICTVERESTATSTTPCTIYKCSKLRMNMWSILNYADFVVSTY